VNRARLSEAAQHSRLLTGALGTALTAVIGVAALIVVGSALGRGMEPGSVASDLITVPAATNGGPGAPERLIQALSGALRAFTGAPRGEAENVPQAIAPQVGDAAPDATPVQIDPAERTSALVVPVAENRPAERPPELVTAATTAAPAEGVFGARGEGEQSHAEPGEAAFAPSPAAAESEPSPPLPAGLAAPTAAPATPTRRPRATAVPPTPTQRPRATPTRTVAAPTRTPTAIRTATRMPTSKPLVEHVTDDRAGSRERRRDD